MIALLPYLPDLLHGVFITCLLTICSIALGFTLALIMTICTDMKVPVVSQVIEAIIFCIRGTPLLVQLFLIYFGLGQFEWLRHSFAWVVFREPMMCAIFTLSLNTACYTTILFRGAIASIPKNEIIACDALGMSKWLALRRIILPQALRLALPAYSNEAMIILKSTSLASTVTLLDLMGVTQKLINETYDTVQWYVVAGIAYLLMNALIFSMFRIWQARSLAKG